MDTQSLPIVSFGKYKDKSVLELLEDEKYVDWLKLQSWFPNQKQIYSIVVHQTIPSSNTNNSKTPEHNKLQNLFLEKDNQLNLLLQLYNYDNFKNKLKLLYADEEFIRCFGINTIPSLTPNLKKSSIKFEDKFNWDLFLSYLLDSQSINIVSKLETEVVDKIKYKEKYDVEQKEIYDNNLLLLNELIEIREVYDKENMDKYEGEMVEYNKQQKIYDKDLKLYFKKSKQNQFDIDNYNKRLQIYHIVSDKYKTQKITEICNELEIDSEHYINWNLQNEDYHLDNNDKTYSVGERKKITAIIYAKTKPFIDEFNKQNLKPECVEKINIPSAPRVPSKPDLERDKILSSDDKHYQTLVKCSKLIHIHMLHSVICIKKKKEEYIKEYADKYDKNFNTHYAIYRKQYYKNILKKYHILDDYNCDCDCDVINGKNQYEINFRISYSNSAVCCELKPTLSDEYPCVLRKLTTQIELTDAYEAKKKKEYNPPFYNYTYTLIVGSFTSKSTSKKQLITIFKQSNIRVVFTDEIFGSSAVDTFQINTESVSFDKKIVEENKILTDNLLQAQQKLLYAEERIKKLEEEILSLKSQNKSTKTIKDYFVKK
jgi:hypothetical protein